MDDRQLTALLPEVLQTRWSRTASFVTPLGGGMNSATALVEFGGDRYVAKWVPDAGRPALQRGTEIAASLDRAGLRAGRPLPARTGELVVPLAGGAVALLEFVPGRPLDPGVHDQQRLAETLGRAHTLLGTSPRSASFFPWLGADPAVGEVADWILPAIGAVRAEYATLPAITWGTLHNDPAPEAFLLDESTGSVGMIDWSGAESGPVLYDVASALMYLGGPVKGSVFLACYAAVAVVPPAELGEHLLTFRRFRAAVQADYFARRILAYDLTGIPGPEGNLTGLADARRMLRTLGLIGH